jgi:acyl-coenzyme A thioesterase PaaI-like protein
LTSELRERAGQRKLEQPAGTAPIRRDRTSAFEFEPHRCFACGELNEQGLHLQIHTDPEHAWTELSLEPRFQGWDSVAHGGIVCTILDEVMAWSVIGRGTWGVTARLNVALRRPVPTGRTIRARGWVVEEHRRACRTAAELVDVESRELLATAEGTFIAIPDDQLAGLRARYGMRRLDGPVRDASESSAKAETTDREDSE